MIMKKILKHIPSFLVIAIFSYTLPAKLVRWEEIQAVFVSTSSAFWGYWGMFSELGIYIIAGMEFLTIIFLLLWMHSIKLKFYGGVIAFLVLLGALYAHIFTPLGIDVAGDSWLLFFLALIAIASSMLIIKKTYKIFY